MESSVYREMNFICMRIKNYFHVNGFALSLALLVLSLAPRGFSPGTPVFPSPQKPTLPNSNSIGDARARLNEFILTVTEAWDKSEIACCACFLLRTKTLPRTQQLLRIFYGSHDGRTESSLVPLRF